MYRNRRSRQNYEMLVAMMGIATVSYWVATVALSGIATVVTYATDHVRGCEASASQPSQPAQPTKVAVASLLSQPSQASQPRILLGSHLHTFTSEEEGVFHGADMGILPISKVELTRRST
jgi:hypothetical protein